MPIKFTCVYHNQMTGWFQISLLWGIYAQRMWVIGFVANINQQKCLFGCSLHGYNHAKVFHKNITPYVLQMSNGYNSLLFNKMNIVYLFLAKFWHFRWWGKSYYLKFLLGASRGSRGPEMHWVESLGEQSRIQSKLLSQNSGWRLPRGFVEFVLGDVCAAWNKLY